MKKVVVIVLVGLMLVVTSPFMLLAATAAAPAEACAQAKIDVSVDFATPSLLWMGAGCLFGIFAIIAGFIVTPDVPSNRILGKSSKYVAEYSDCYKEEGKGKQWLCALSGCSLTVAISCAIWSIMILNATPKY
jgi:hypothetical protein